jgi:hypothetical protein
MLHSLIEAVRSKSSQHSNRLSALKRSITHTVHKQQHHHSSATRRTSSSPTASSRRSHNPVDSPTSSIRSPRGARKRIAHSQAHIYETTSSRLRAQQQQQQQQQRHSHNNQVPGGSPLSSPMSLSKKKKKKSTSRSRDASSSPPPAGRGGRSGGGAFSMEMLDVAFDSIAEEWSTWYSDLLHSLEGVAHQYASEAALLQQHTTEQQYAHEVNRLKYQMLIQKLDEMNNLHKQVVRN